MEKNLHRNNLAEWLMLIVLYPIAWTSKLVRCRGV
jgi:hypothetical protein